MFVTVRKEDIFLGNRCSIRRCPVALALQRQGGAWAGLYILDLGDGAYVPTPAAVREWMRRFDIGDPVGGDYVRDR